MNSCKNHLSYSISNARSLLAPFVCPQERLKNDDRANEALANSQQPPDENHQARYTSNYGLRGWDNLTTADLVHNVLTARVLLDPTCFPFLHDVDLPTVSAFLYFRLSYREHRSSENNHQRLLSSNLLPSYDSSLLWIPKCPR